MNFNLENDRLGFSEANPEHKKTPLRGVVFILIGFLFIFYFLFLSAPFGFPAGAIFKINEGSTLRSVSLKLKNENIIRSRLAFEAFVIITSGEKRVIKADYYFENKLPVYEIARRISKGEHHIEPISVTIPEGFDTTQIADTFASKFINFDRNKFLSKAAELEGYLFPDTYFFFITANEQDVLESMGKNFNKKIAVIRPEIISSGKTEKEIIKMASLLERESKGDLDVKLISGILWKRIKIGMPLQADAAPETYLATGLPKNPISNPGLRAIRAAIYPQSSPYLYYLHDKNGVVHYARTFAEHRQNIVKYLK